MKNVLKALITIFLGLMPLSVFASDPGVGNGPEPRVPQGPNDKACLNQGGFLNPSGKGIPNAIASEGAVHCDGIHILGL